ncbi:N-lysine methyltransferase KMT5A-A-like isoform X2 [Uloborus diversus]|uniref:N-lysine methyltransferase KMT5A-A-like isoform X2 n=1 Tax=Uloborus diversus TaxID=327109 RepID=UPI00240A2EAE|nr:N-lysine methyltransferase KMT5A-A-like isoform X2 [Uloborus diversus]
MSEKPNEGKYRNILNMNVQEDCLRRRKRHSNKENSEQKQFRVTDYFPIRRSNRKAVYVVKKENQKLIEETILSGVDGERKNGFQVKHFPDKGRGIITTRALMCGQFVMEYHGELIDYREAKRREMLYAEKNVGCYMYYFKLNKCYCIDATEESDRLGRLINHSKRGNLKTRIIFVKDQPRLGFFACRDVRAGEELSYDYGDRSKLSLQFHPWLAA